MKSGAWLSVLAVIAFLGIAVVFTPNLLILLPAVMVLVAGVIVARRKPERALATCFFLVPLAATKYRIRDPLASISGSADYQILIELGLYCLILVLTVVAASRLKGRIPLAWPEIGLGLYVLLAMFSSAWSPAVLFTAVRSFQLGILLLLALVSGRCLGSPGTIRAAVAGCLLYTFSFSMLALLVPGVGPQTSVLFGARFTWFQLHPGTVATLAATGALLLVSGSVFGSGIGTRRLGSRAVWAAVVFLVCLLLATRGRGALVGFAASIGALVLLRSGRAWATAGILFMGAMAAVVLLSVGSSFDDIIRAAAESNTPGLVYLFRGQTAEQFSSLTGRVDLWKFALGIVLERPFLGHGYLSSRTVLAAFTWAGYAHNGLIQSLLDFGLFGTALVWGTAIGVVGKTILPLKHGVRRKSVVEAAAFAVVFYLLVNSVGSESFAGPPGWDVFLLFVCVVVTARPRWVRQQVIVAEQAQ